MEVKQEDKLNIVKILLGKKAQQLLNELARENDMLPKYYYTKILVREAKAEATMLPFEKLQARLQLIDEVNDELVDIINTAPVIADDASPRQIYARVWAQRKRWRSMGFSEEEIHHLCLQRYGIDPQPKRMPQRNNNPNGRKVKVDG